MPVKKKKVEEVKAAPIISKLPIAISDSPLVIDLPDGQKLVVGRMVQGSVIEVATWRGTGRPDSRTSRLMLGMSIDGVSQTAEQKAAEEAANATPNSEQRTSKISNPQLARVQEFFWVVAAHPLYKKLFGESEPKKARAPKASKATPPTPVVPVATATVVTAAPAAPAPTWTPSSAPAQQKKPGRSVNFFSKKPAKKSKVSAPKGATPAWSLPSSQSSENTDIDAWLDEISSKAKARVENKSAKPASPVKKAAAAKKSAKKGAPVANKRK